jgi:hypothetical protein
MPTSPDTLLRRIKEPQSAATPAPPPRVVGVDDWANRKGQTYGTIVVDLQRGQVLGLLPGRDGASLESGLRQHPQIECLSRDRWSALAEAASAAAPPAQPVADRWHLLENAREALARFLDRHQQLIRQAFAPAEPVANAAPPSAATPAPETAPVVQASGTPPAPSPVVHPQRVPTGKPQRRWQRYQEARGQQQQGQSLRQIARQLQLSWRSVRRYVQSDHCPDWQPGRRAPRKRLAIVSESTPGWRKATATSLRCIVSCKARVPNCATTCYGDW